jgi:hypothetical protein
MFAQAVALHNPGQIGVPRPHRNSQHVPMAKVPQNARRNTAVTCDPYRPLAGAPE